MGGRESTGESKVLSVSESVGERARPRSESADKEQECGLEREHGLERECGLERESGLRCERGLERERGLQCECESAWEAVRARARSDSACERQRWGQQIRMRAT